VINEEGVLRQTVIVNQISENITLELCNAFTITEATVVQTPQSIGVDILYLIIGNRVGIQNRTLQRIMSSGVADSWRAS
jgi:hypothetical protein